MLMRKVLPKLRPKLAPWMLALVNDPSAAFKYVEESGSPANVHNLEPFFENLSGFSEILSGKLDSWEIFYACKANRCPEFVAAAIAEGYGVDTGSLAEFRQALALGAKPEKVVLTSAVKSEALMDESISAGILITIDNYDELSLVAARAKALNKTARIALRLSGFPHSGGILHSRFGFDCKELPELMRKVSLLKPDIALAGIQFHLNGYSLEERLSALDFIFQAECFYKDGKPVLEFIDIGGGIPVCYLESEVEWNEFQNELREALLGNRIPITFGNNGLGFISDGEKLFGSFAVYPFWNALSKERYLSQLLSSLLSDGRPVAGHFNSKQIQFRCELGRALLDQCGVTLARVMFRKPAADGRQFVGLDMNYTQLSSSSADFLLDPVLLSQGPVTVGGDVEVYFVGNYCLERDLLLKRAVNLPSRPDVGDLILFPNTAAYLMHLHENGGHSTPVAQNILSALKISGRQKGAREVYRLTGGETK